MPKWTDEGLKLAKIISQKTNGQISIVLRDIYDSSGQVISSLHDLTSQNYGGAFAGPAIMADSMDRDNQSSAISAQAADHAIMAWVTTHPPSLLIVP